VALGSGAGAVGIFALNLVTYVDMAVRGRAASETPADVVKRMEDRAGITLAGEGRGSQREVNRREAVGALLGFAIGLGLGVLYGVVRPGMRTIPSPVTGTCLGLLAMAGSDVPAMLLGATDPSRWSPAEWTADLVPHLAYGVCTAVAFDALADPYD